MLCTQNSIWGPSARRGSKFDNYQAYDELAKKTVMGMEKIILFFPAGFWVGAKTLLSRFTLGGPRRRNLLYISLCYEGVSILGNWNDDGES